MSTGFVPWADAALEQLQSYQGAAFFVLGCIEREHRLNLDALVAYWLCGPMNRSLPAATRGVSSESGEARARLQTLATGESNPNRAEDRIGRSGNR
jgi:hypothetical protein